MKKITVVLMSIVFIAFMGLSVSANSDEPKPVDGTLPTVTDPSTPPDGGEIVNPCGEGIEVCIFSGSEGTSGEISVCSTDEQGKEICEVIVNDPKLENAQPVDQVIDEVPADCEKDPTVCQRTDGEIKTLAPTDGHYEDGVYYMTGTKDKDAQKNKDMVTVTVIASSLGLILLGLAINRKIKKN